MPKATVSVTAEEPHLVFAGPAEWAVWLKAHCSESSGVWLKMAKKGTGVTTITYAEAVDVALSYGWIDSQMRRLDDTYFVQRFTPRRARSPWSKINRAKAEAMIAAGQMEPTGLAEVERAKADGRWEAAYDGPSTAVVPDDLAAALAANPAAADFFATLDAQNRYAILHRLQTAPKPETRARRLGKFVDQLARGEKIHP